MRKILFVFAMVGVFVFSACEKEPTPIDIPITCESYEELQNGVCVIVDYEAKLIIDVFDNLDTFNDYTLLISVQYPLDSYEMTIEFDDTKSSFEIDDNKEFYMYNNGINEHYFKQSGFYHKESSSELLTDDFLFFYNLKAEMFTSQDGKYYLNIQSYSEIESFFETEFPDCIVQNFEMTIASERISGMAFDVVVDEINYHMVMTFSLIGETTITLPTV